MKLFKFLPISMLLALSFMFLVKPVVTSAETIKPMVSIVKLPEYTNDRDFEISYTALDAGGSGLKEVTVSYMKDGGSWQTIGSYSTASNKVNVNNSQLNEDKKYFFKAEACDNDSNCATDETNTTLDTSSPPKPEGYSKEKTGVQTYKIKWHNPNSDDLYKTQVYRSENKNFDLNSGTQVSEVSVTKNTDSEYIDWVVPDATKTYYYAIRNMDKATNVSDAVGDTYTVVVLVSPSPGTVVNQDQSPSSPLSPLSPQVVTTANLRQGQVLGETEASPSALPEQTPYNDPTPELQSGSKKLLFGGIAFVGLVLILTGYFLKKSRE
jgi:hypothetical protein